MKNILWYKFVALENLEELQEQLTSKGEDLGVFGKILIAKEGINGCLSGEEKSLQAFADFIFTYPEFEDVVFKVTKAHRHTFDKVVKVKIRDEIITAKFGELPSPGRYIEPQELKRMYEEGEEFYIIDGRNDYESDIGKFKNALTPNTAKFSDLPQTLKNYEHLKDKKIVTYCTGGIRCEKVTALMKKHGFNNVYQLHGGIIKYGEECGDAFWEGGCFVFDNRFAIGLDSEITSYTKKDAQKGTSI